MAERWLYRGKIEHTAKTVELLYRTTYYAYSKARMLIRLGIGAALVIVSVAVALPMWARALLMLLGAWLMASKDFPSQIRADRVMEARGGSLPGMEYEFYNGKVHLSGEGSMDIPYKRFSRLVEDESYLYLFISKDSVCMLERASVEPQPAEELMKFLEGKTGLKWRREKSLLSMNLWDLRQIIRDIRESK